MTAPRGSRRRPQRLVSVIIVNWNGKAWLRGCLDSLRAQTYPRLEVILVDNGSRDGSVDFVRSRYRGVRVIANPDNRGFATANNQGVREARGELVLLLNNDTRLPRNCLQRLVEGFDRIPRLGSLQPKLVFMDRPVVLDCCGSYWTGSSLLYHYGAEKPARRAIYSRPQPFFSNKGAAMLIRRDLIGTLGLFDDDFWCYYEETDFCHRLWLTGYECWYYPEATVYHARGGTTETLDNAHIQFHNFKNKLCSFLKNFQARSLAVVLPAFLVVTVLLSLGWLGQGKYRHAAAVYRALWWNLRHLPGTLAKRRTVQGHRTRSDRQVARKAKRNPRLSFYYHLWRGTLERYVDAG